MKNVAYYLFKKGYANKITPQHIITIETTGRSKRFLYFFVFFVSLFEPRGLSQLTTIIRTPGQHLDLLRVRTGFAGLVVKKKAPAARRSILRLFYRPLNTSVRYRQKQRSNKKVPNCLQAWREKREQKGGSTFLYSPIHHSCEKRNCTSHSSSAAPYDG